jgi:hypothetical protein
MNDQQDDQTTADDGPDSVATAAALDRETRQQKIAGTIIRENPTWPYITALIVAGDRISAENAWDYLVNGATFVRALVRVGSYARVDFAVRALDADLVDERTVFRMLPELWRSSDPDDEDPRFLDLWLRAYEWNGSYLRDGRALPRTRVLDVYRGQDPIADADTLHGIAWSLDREVAEKFARGAALRTGDRDGTIYHARINRSSVLGYLTLRGEAEVVVDPWALY